LELAESRLGELQTELVLLLNPGKGDDPFAKALTELTNQLVEVAQGKLRLVLDPDDSPYPTLKLKNIQYLAVPVDQELEPFLDLLLYLSNGVDLVPPEVGPARLELMVAPTCPNCPAVVRACGQLAACMPQVEMVVVDVQYFTQLAGSCRSVPTVIIDGTHTVVGPVGPTELLDLLRQRDAPDNLVRALTSMIEARRLPEMIPLLASDEGYSALATIMKDGTMQQKMGLLLAVEELLEEGDPHRLDGAVPHLLPLLESEVATLRGDAADLLGRIGAPGAKDALTHLLDDENPDVQEVAQEALSMLRDPS